MHSLSTDSMIAALTPAGGDAAETIVSWSPAPGEAKRMTSMTARMMATAARPANFCTGYLQL